MSRAREQSIKERIRTLSRERNLTFAELWQNLILERFLARLCQSEYKKHFIFKGGSLLARYIDLGRETRDLDFLVHHMANAIESLGNAMDHICSIDLDDAFSFERIKTAPLAHPHMHYTGAQIARLQPVWHDYYQQLQLKGSLPSKFEEVVSTINHWLAVNTFLCHSTTETIMPAP